MKVPLQITFRDIAPTPAIEERIREKAEALERYTDKITSCRVAVESPHHRHHKGQLYRVRIDITVPGHEIVVSREEHDDHAHEDLYVAIRDSFEAARRQIEDYMRRHHPR